MLATVNADVDGRVLPPLMLVKISKVLGKGIKIYLAPCIEFRIQDG